MEKIISTNGARRKIALAYNVKDYNKISVKDVGKFFDKIEDSPIVRWEPKREFLEKMVYQ